MCSICNPIRRGWIHFLIFLSLVQMKLEKIRTSSMDKIMNKLRSAQRKAQEMRSSVSTSQDYQISRTTNKVAFFRKSNQMSSLSGCFTCHAFWYSYACRSIFLTVKKAGKCFNHGSSVLKFCGNNDMGKYLIIFFLSLIPLFLSEIFQHEKPILSFSFGNSTLFDP